MGYVQTRQNYITKDPGVWAHFMSSEMSDVSVLSRAQLSSMQVRALPHEDLVQIVVMAFVSPAHPQQALVVPIALQIISAKPFAKFGRLSRRVYLETVVLGETFHGLLSRD